MRRLCISLALAAIAAKPAAAEELLVAAAVSLRGPLEAIAERFEAAHAGAQVQLAFGASSALSAQARAGAPFDVFLAADEESIDALAAAGLVRAGSRKTIAGNRLVVVASADLKAPIESAADLARPEVRRIALAERAVPVGHYAREWLAGRGILEALAPRFVATEHARATLAAVDAGNADAGIVYATDVKAARSARVAFTPPEAEQPRIVYVAALLTSGRAPALAGAFLAELGDPAARRDFEAAGFPPPPGDPAP
ncbi:MAG TPA: molybdate ABC transporter substrate-binding protein [Myxococcota bacterium]|jgi:molybdate transport system substrate-binding protein